MDINKKLRQVLGKYNGTERIPDGNILFRGLEPFMPRGISKGKLITICGEPDSGKTLLALDIVKNNSDKTFLYIDTYNRINKDYENMLVASTNQIDEIKEILSSVNNEVVDTIIVDGLLNVISYNERTSLFGTVYDQNNIVVEFLRHIIEFALMQRIPVIAISQATERNGRIYPNGPMDINFLSSIFIRINSKRMIINSETNMIKEVYLDLDTIKNSADRNNNFVYKVEL